jgi:hypothetical protein
MRLKTCANCPNWGDVAEEKLIDDKPHRGCHGALPQFAGDPRGLGRFPSMPRDGWCAHHGITPSTPTHTSADYLEFGQPEDQPT